MITTNELNKKLIQDIRKELIDQKTKGSEPYVEVSYSGLYRDLEEYLAKYGLFSVALPGNLVHVQDYLLDTQREFAKLGFRLVNASETNITYAYDYNTYHDFKIVFDIFGKEADVTLLGFNDKITLANGLVKVINMQLEELEGEY